MPIYEYRCSSCGHELEALQKITEPVLTQCPACRREALVKQVSAAGFQLKGSGWYATDFKNGREKPRQVRRQSGRKGRWQRDRCDVERVEGRLRQRIQRFEVGMRYQLRVPLTSRTATSRTAR